MTFSCFRNFLNFSQSYSFNFCIFFFNDFFFTYFFPFFSFVCDLFFFVAVVVDVVVIVVMFLSTYIYRLYTSGRGRALVPSVIPTPLCNDFKKIVREILPKQERHCTALTYMLS